MLLLLKTAPIADLVLSFNQKENVMEEKDLKWVYGAILSAPEMDELVKLDFKQAVR